MSYKLEYPYTEEQLNDFIVEYNHQQNLRIETVDNFVEEENHSTYYALEANEIIVNGEVIIDPDYEEKEVQKERERITKLTCTKRVFALMLQEVGIDYFTMLKPLIESNPQAQLEWELCVELQRGNPLLNVMADELGISSEKLDAIFKLANNEITQEEFIQAITPQEEIQEKVEEVEKEKEEVVE